MTSDCSWADDSTPAADDPDATPCPRCGTPIAAVSSAGPDTAVATPCGCPVPADTLESE